MMNRTLLIVGAALVLLLGIALGWVAKGMFTPPCDEVVAREVTREVVKPDIPDGRTTGVVGNVKVKPSPKAPAKINLKPATGLTGGTVAKDTPAPPITPPEVTIDSAGVVEIPITEKEYKTEDYKLTVRGFQPELKAIELYPKVQTVITRKVPRWSLTVGPGCGYTSDGQFVPALQATLGFVIWSK